jgi:putative oxygen-independent coproporphyrinogen III oxidase
MSSPGLYVHVPFCRTKCAYCGFFSQTDLSLVSLWMNALIREAKLYEDFSGPFDSLFLGGGTPTVLSPSALELLIHGIFMDLSFKDSTEFTVEANPDDITTDTLALLKDLGVNRLSLGVQSLEDGELALLGRRHSAAQAEKALDLARLAGFKSLSVDLMFGLPGQTVSSWLKTLRRTLTFEPDHLSCYQLTFEKHTTLGKMAKERKIAKIGVGVERELFLVNSRFLEQEGYSHYEVSNFARPGHLCLHNLKYWDRTPYLGLGPAAHSFDGRARWWNTSSLRRYHRRLLYGNLPVVGKEVLSEESRMLECLLLGFRTTQGIEIGLVRHVPGWDSKVRQLEESGLAIVREGRLLPTQEGLLYADGLPLLFA